MDKLGRNYNLYIQTDTFTPLQTGGAFDASVLTPSDSGFLLITPPLTIEFDIEHSTESGGPNHASFRIYNLSKKHRAQIFKPQINNGSFKQIQLQAGYQNTIPVIFNGNIREAWSVREGNNFITQVEAYDGGFSYQNAFTSTEFPAKVKTQTVLSTLMDSLGQYGIGKGAIGNFPQLHLLKNSFSDSTTSLLKELSGDGFFIYNGKAFCLNSNEVVDGVLNVIDSNSGLLGTPFIEGGIFVTLEMLFEPRIVMGQKIKLDSKTFDLHDLIDFGIDPNADYKVVGLHHKGMISETVCGEAITTLKLSGGLAFNTVTQ